MLYAAAVLLVSGCAAGSNQQLVIDTRQVPAVDYPPDEVPMKRHRVLQQCNVTTHSKNAWNGSSAWIALTSH